LPPWDLQKKNVDLVFGACALGSACIYAACVITATRDSGIYLKQSIQRRDKLGTIVRLDTALDETPTSRSHSLLRVDMMVSEMHLSRFGQWTEAHTGKQWTCKERGNFT
jgi:hypothetical protein